MADIDVAEAEIEEHEVLSELPLDSVPLVEACWWWWLGVPARGWWDLRFSDEGGGGGPRDLSHSFASIIIWELLAAVCVCL